MPEAKIVLPGRFAVMAQPEPHEIKELAGQGYRTLINNRPDNETQNQPATAEIRTAAEQQGLRYAQLPVLANTIGQSDIDAFRQLLAEGPHPVLAHCGTGRRSYMLWAAGEALYGGRSVDELTAQGTSLGLDVKDLPQVIERLR